MKRVSTKKGYLVYVQGWSKGQRYVWDAEDIEDGGYVDCPNGKDDIFTDRDEAEELLTMVEDYIAEHDYELTAAIEEVVIDHTIDSVSFQGQVADTIADGTLQYLYDGESVVVTGEFKVKGGRVEHLVDIDDKTYIMRVTPNGENDCEFDLIEW